jgi:hypothetical protein
MTKKWYNLFVSVEQPASQEGTPAKSSGGAPSPAQAVADLAASIQAPASIGPVADPNSFDQIYAAAEITTPSHGYTILKLAEMLQSEHIRALPVDVKRSSIYVALEAAGVKIEEVIQDAIRRDKALDTYERVQQNALGELQAQKDKENAGIQAEMEKMAAEHTARIQANQDAVEREKQRVFGWLLKKRQEEQRIADAVAPFVTENPITRSGGVPPGTQAPGGPSGRT